MADAFLSYSRADEAAVLRIRERLKEAGLSSFLDRARLAAGQPWQPWLEREIGTARAVVVFVGRSGMGSWQHRETQLALSRQGRESAFPVIPVILPGVVDPPTGTFLTLNTWVDLRTDESDPKQLHRLLSGIAGRPPESDSTEIRAAICPYRGLLTFREEDAGLYFGRAEDSKKLLDLVLTKPVVAVVGRSGSGKSSLVYAGLLPALRKRVSGRTWDVVSIRPGTEPLHALVRAFSPPPEADTAVAQRKRLNTDVESLRSGTVALEQLVEDRLREDEGTDRLLLHVDQWEELYTQRRSENGEEHEGGREDADAFIDCLLAATRAKRTTLVLTLRADWFDSLLKHRDLAVAIQGSQLNLATMTRPQLQACIVEPARVVSLDVDSQVVTDMLDEVGADGGKLPLLEYALAGTWRNRDLKTGRLTLEAYAKAGRIDGAIGERAEQIYGGLCETERHTARRLFVNLVSIGEGREDTRAPAAIPEDPEVERIVQAFSASGARLLVTGGGEESGPRTVEVTHEALIRSWPTFRKWVDENREFLRTRDRLAAQRRHWRESGWDASLLLQPGRALEEGRQFLAEHGDIAIAPELRSYIDGSIATDERQRARLVAAEEERRARLLAIEEERRRVFEEERRRRIRTLTTLALTGALLAAFAFWQWRAATEKTNAMRAAQRLAREDADRLRDQSALGRALLAVETLFNSDLENAAEAARVITDAEASLTRLRVHWQDLDRLRKRTDRLDPEDQGRLRLLDDIVRDGDALNAGKLDTLRGRFAAAGGTKLWDETIAAIRDDVANPIYRGKVLPGAQHGLWPLGKDPDSGLFEFAHLHSGSSPRRDVTTGRIILDNDTALVFVLIPGGTFNQGAQATHAHEQNFDRSASPDEGRVHEVTVPWFFLSKYECTQPQWERLSSGERPSRFRGPRRPVERVSWDDCVGKPGWLLRHGLQLPTESQWEFACRTPLDNAGQRRDEYEPWSSGTDERSLARVAILFASETAVVGSRDPNDFGLHDMHGNVCEWCGDNLDSYNHSTLPTHAVRGNVYRGGSWAGTPPYARSAYRDGRHRGFSSPTLGVRPAKAVRP